MKRLVFFLYLGFFWPLVSFGALSFQNLPYPRLANLFLKTPIMESEASMLVRWDVVILGVQAQDTNPEIFRILRKKNPKIIILAYVAPTEFPVSRLSILESQGGPWHELMKGISDRWWLRDEEGRILSFWQGNQSLNVTDSAPMVDGERWNTFFPKFLQKKVFVKHRWDGIFFDSVWPTISWFHEGNLDLDNDGRRESFTMLDEQWKRGMETIFRETRRRLGREAILIGNGGDDFTEVLNGRMLESFPNPQEGGWEKQMSSYTRFLSKGQKPHLLVLNGDTENTGKFEDFRDMRFALTSALLADGFFSYDWGTQDHSQLWWYDEYDQMLGKSIRRPREIHSKVAPGINWRQGVFRRDFEKGVLFVNATRRKQTMILDETLEHFSGTQDSRVNNGKLVTRLVIPGEDGRVLLKRLAVVDGVVFPNGIRTKVFNNEGKEVRRSFYAYTARGVGGRLVAIWDFDRDGRKEMVTASGNRIVVRKEKDRMEFFPYSSSFRGNVNFVLGDIDQDNKTEIITGTEEGAAPHVRVFSVQGRPIHPGFFAGDLHDRFGVEVSIGDLEGDGRMEIVTGRGQGGSPEVRIFDAMTGKLLRRFFAYDPREKFGVHVAIGDVDADGKGEVITGPGRGGSPHVRIFDGMGKPKTQGFFGFSKQERSGVRVAVSDVAGSRGEEILTLDPSLFER